MNAMLVNAVFDCGTDDLRLLDDAECDMFEVIKTMRDEGIDTSMNNIIEEVFKTGKQVIVDAYNERLQNLESEEKAGVMTEASYEQLQQLRELNPKEDFSWWINLQDTDFHGDSDKQEIYEALFEEELEECVRLTGYDIKW